MRICSLVPSATETLYALGLGDSVLGITHDCDFPPEVTTEPVLIKPRVDPQAPQAEIDRQVRELVSRGESIYGVDADLLRSISPDLIVTQDLCQVCAASPDDLATALMRFPNPPQVLALTPTSLADVWGDIRRIGEAAGCRDVAGQLAQELEERVANITAATARADARPRVLCLEWLDPFYVGGHWVPEMVAKAGGVDVFGRAGEASFRVTSEEIAACGAEVIVVMLCGYNLARTIEELRRYPIPAAWNGLPAVRDHRIFASDANSHFSRPGPRLAEGVEVLAHLIHPELFPEAPATDALARI
jgi:iron complex transport system substrate-binding protein